MKRNEYINQILIFYRNKEKSCFDILELNSNRYHQCNNCIFNDMVSDCNPILRASYLNEMINNLFIQELLEI